MAVSSKYTQDLSVQIVSFTFSFKWFLLFLLLGCNLSYIVDLFAALHELASASVRTLLKLASSVRALLKPYGDTLSNGPSVQAVLKTDTLVRVPNVAVVINNYVFFFSFIDINFATPKTIVGHNLN